MSIFRRFSNLFVRSSLEREIDAELRAHIEMRTEDNIAAGMSAEAARRDARIRFGNDDANRVLIKSLETAFALQILQRTHDRPSPQNAFVGWGFGRRNGELMDRH